jgi:nucleoside-diphosphate-sugar epimerase
MKVLLTGGSGFLGSAISRHLVALGHQVDTLGRTKTNTILCDLSEEVPVLTDYDMVVHAAGKAHSIPGNKLEEEEFYKGNVTATANLLAALGSHPPKRLVFISSVAVYGADTGEGISEEMPLNGKTPYSKSKIQAEELIRNWAEKKEIPAVILRPPLITGHNPPGNLQAMYRAMKRGYYFRIGQGSARKSMVAADDIAALIPMFGEGSGAYNLTDGIHPSLFETEEKIAAMLGKKVWSIPLMVLKLGARIGDLLPGFPLTTLRLSKLQSSLTFDDSKARRELGWKPGKALDKLSF